MLKFTERSKKTWLALKGISSLQVIFVPIWMKKTLWFNLQRDGTGNELSNTKDTFAESLQPQMSVLCQRICIFKTSGLSWWLSLIVNMMAGQDIKKKYLCQIPIKVLKQHSIPNSSSRNLKIYSSKGIRKTCQRWIIYVYLSNQQF